MITQPRYLSIIDEFLSSAFFQVLVKKNTYCR